MPSDYSQTTICFLFNDRSEILLAFKKRGFGKGKWNGVGGKVKDGEQPIDAARREITEEVGVLANELTPQGSIEFVWPESMKENNTVSYIFSTRSFTGEPTESEECRPQWFSLNAIPYEHMWDDDKYWYPKMINGETLHLKIYFNDQSIVERVESL